MVEIGDPHIGLISIEPMALAKGVDSATIYQIAPEASDYGSGKTTFSPGRSPTIARCSLLFDHHFVQLDFEMFVFRHWLR